MSQRESENREPRRRVDEGRVARFSPPSPPRLGEPSLDKRQGEDFQQASRRYVSDLNSEHATYLAASGTLVQFNAIVVGIHGVLLTSVEAGPLKITIALALLTHVVAAFLLCWAARPGGRKSVSGRNPDIVDRYLGINDTYRHYRRGWWIMLFALTISSLAAVMFVLRAFGVSI